MIIYIYMGLSRFVYVSLNIGYLHFPRILIIFRIKMAVGEVGQISILRDSEGLMILYSGS